MRRAIRAFACAICWFAACCGPALAATNGELAAVVDGRLVTLNADSSGVRVLPVPDAGQITELAFSPGGNRLAFVKAGEINVLDLASGRVLSVVVGGGSDANPAWASDGRTIAFRRGLLTYRVTVATGAIEPYFLDLSAGTTELAWAPGLNAFASVIAGVLMLPGLRLDLPPAVTGVPAWAPDDSAVAFARADGLSTIPTAGGAAKPVVEGPATAPRWSPDASALVYAAGAEVRVVRAAGGQPVTITAGADRAGPVDWQPCVGGTTLSCESVAPPRCSATTATVTTQSDQPVDLPAPPCTDPAGRPLELVVAKAPEHGTVDGLRYTPAAGFSGQDAVAYRVNNGVADSAEVYRVTVFVVPRPVAAVPVPGVRAPVLVQGAPFLSARATPRLDRKRTTVIRVACDQDCSLAVRLSARLRSN